MRISLVTISFRPFVDRSLKESNDHKPKTIKNDIYRLQHPCDGCEAPYGFRNLMKLDTDTKQFAVSADNESDLRYVKIHV